MYSEDQYNTLPDIALRDESQVRSFMTGVFSWMFIALAVTAGVAYLVAQTPQILSLLITETGLSIFGWVVMLAPLGFVMLMSFRFQKLSAVSLIALFLVYLVLMGLSLLIFLAYSWARFPSPSGSHRYFRRDGCLEGSPRKTTHQVRSILMMATGWLIIASLINLF
jgi:FtsH-binding integral membrane protein